MTAMANWLPPLRYDWTLTAMLPLTGLVMAPLETSWKVKTGVLVIGEVVVPS
jgi:hypothetical protein